MPSPCADGLAAIARLADAQADGPLATILLPAGTAPVRLIESAGAAPLQEATVARLTAMEDALSPVIADARFIAPQRLLLGMADRAMLETLVADVRAAGAVPTAIIPLGALFFGDAIAREATIEGDEAADVTPAPGPALAPARISWADQQLLITSFGAVPDEPGLAALVGEADAPSLVSEAEATARIMAAIDRPPLNLLDQMPDAIPRQPLFDPDSRRRARQLAALALLLLLAIFVVHWGRMEWAIARENRATLALVQKLVPGASDAATAEGAYRAALAARGIETAGPPALMAALWRALARQDQVSATAMEAGQSGTLSATIQAPDPAAINAVLLDLQRSGYAVTAQPRREASGATVADITVRMP